MTDHLSATTLNALADGELSTEELAIANQHLADCPACTSSALYQSLLKSSTASAGRRYTLPPKFRIPLEPKAKSRLISPGWVAAAVLLVVLASTMLVEHITRKSQIATAERAALVTEVFDQHVATLAGNSPPQVVSTDRHTVKPWFQGKLPFSFNLPESLPRDTTLDGANLTYVHNQPVAQLLYSVGKHRVSVFVRQKRGTTKPSTTQQAGFQVMDAATGDLEMVAVSDVDPTRLAELVSAIRQAQVP